MQIYRTKIPDELSSNSSKLSRPGSRPPLPNTNKHFANANDAIMVGLGPWVPSGNEMAQYLYSARRPDSPTRYLRRRSHYYRIRRYAMEWSWAHDASS